MPLMVQDLTNPSISLMHSAGFAARINTLMGVEYNSRQFTPTANDRMMAVHRDLFEVKDGFISTKTLDGPGLGFQIEKFGW